MPAAETVTVTTAVWTDEMTEGIAATATDETTEETAVTATDETIEETAATVTDETTEGTAATAIVTTDEEMQRSFRERLPALLDSARIHAAARKMRERKFGIVKLG